MISQTALPWIAVLLLNVPLVSESLENGLARTPPMGWMTWQRFRCQVDCVKYPNDCISEQLIKRTADRMVAGGYLAVGYRYLIIDDCWSALQRDRVTNQLVADPIRFPNGIQALSNYIHSKGLLFGLYLDYGKLTCSGYPGSLDYLELDANSLAQWGVDYVKVDGCYSSPAQMPAGYELFGKYLNQTGRPIVYSCSYPAYVNWRESNYAVDWERLKRNCNLWRMLFDVQDRWLSVITIINIYRANQTVIQPLSGPGHWNDPDMLLLGNFGLSLDQQRVQMGMWCMFAAPLLISADMDDMNWYSSGLLRNPYLLAIDQDAGGHQAIFIKDKLGVQLWTRVLTHNRAKWAIAFVYQADGGGPFRVTVTMREMGITRSAVRSDLVYNLRDVFDGSVFGTVALDEPFDVQVNPTGITMYQVEETRPAESQTLSDYSSWFNRAQRNQNGMGTSTRPQFVLSNRL